MVNQLGKMATRVTKTQACVKQELLQETERRKVIEAERLAKEVHKRRLKTMMQDKLNSSAKWESTQY